MLEVHMRTFVGGGNNLKSSVNCCGVKAIKRHQDTLEERMKLKMSKYFNEKHSLLFYPFQESRGVDIQLAPPLNFVHGVVLTCFLAEDVAGHKHGDEVTCGEPPLVRLGGFKSILKSLM